MIFTRVTSETADVNGCTSLPKTVGNTCYGYHGEQETGSLVPIMEPNFLAAWAVYSRYTEIGLQANGAQIQGPPKKCVHTLTKENSTLYNRLL